MKKLILPAIFSIAILGYSCQSKSSHSGDNTSANDSSFVKEHTSQNSLDWAGVYEGTIPCADCEGIKTTIKLKDNDTFTYNAEYVGKNASVQDSGKFMWHDNGSIVHLTGQDLNTQYKVGENVLIQLDTEGKKIEGSIAEKYKLNKVQ